MSLIKQYRRELDAMLLTGDPNKLIEFMRQRGLSVPSSYEAAECAMHKAITGSPGLPLDLRRKSKAWLDQRGFHSLDDGDL